MCAYMHMCVLVCVYATSCCNSVNHVSQSERGIQILLQFDWTVQFSLLPSYVTGTWKNTVATALANYSKHLTAHGTQASTTCTHTTPKHQTAGV